MLALDAKFGCVPLLHYNVFGVSLHLYHQTTRDAMYVQGYLKFDPAVKRAQNKDDIVEMF